MLSPDLDPIQRGLTDEIGEFFDSMTLYGTKYKSDASSGRQIIAMHARDDDLGLEKVRVVNWLTEDMTDVFRPINRSLTGDEFPSCIEDEPGVLYSVTNRDLLGKYIHLPLSTGGEAHVTSVVYELFDDKIRLIGQATDDGRYTGDFAQGVERHQEIETELREKLQLEFLLREVGIEVFG